MQHEVMLTNFNEKKHAPDLSPYPTELIPFQSVDGADTRYGQIYKPISAHPFKEAGIKGFTPIQPFKVTKDVLAQTNQCAVFHWPSLSELNDKIAPFPWADNSEYERYMSGDSITNLPVLTTGPPPAAPNHSIPSVPAIHLITAAIIKSTDHLFFVSHSIGANDCFDLPILHAGWPLPVCFLHLPSCRLALQCSQPALLDSISRS
jgi:hypothetical protein